MRDHGAVVDAMYAAYFAGDIEGALEHCHEDAEWHGITPAPIAGTHSIRTYLSELLPGAIEGMTDYAILSVDRDSIDDLITSRVRSTHGSGVMVFRVVDEKISDIWVINSKGRDVGDSPYF
jgi:ketosteroid isomerase-like protein